MSNPFAKTAEQIAADMSINFFGYPKQSKCLNCPAPMWIRLEGARRLHDRTCVERETLRKAG